MADRNVRTGLLCENWPVDHRVCEVIVGVIMRCDCGHTHTGGYSRNIVNVCGKCGSASTVLGGELYALGRNTDEAIYCTPEAN